jgi:hypothetical protein
MWRACLQLRLPSTAETCRVVQRRRRMSSVQRENAVAGAAQPETTPRECRGHRVWLVVAPPCLRRFHVDRFVDAGDAVLAVFVPGHPVHVRLPLHVWRSVSADAAAVRPVRNPLAQVANHVPDAPARHAVRARSGWQGRRRVAIAGRDAVTTVARIGRSRRRHLPFGVRKQPLARQGACLLRLEPRQVGRWIDTQSFPIQV